MLCSFFAGGVNRPDIDDFFRGRICEPAPRQPEQAQHDENDPKRLVHKWPPP